MSPDTVSVVLPTYGDEEFLPRAINSIEKQTYGDLEVIIVDSAGSESVQELVSNRRQFTYLYEDPNGPGAARNAGINSATGEFIAFLDADDMWLPKKTELQVRKLEAENADFVYSDQYIAAQSDNENQLDPGSWEFRRGMELTTDEPPHVKFFREGSIGLRTVMIRRKCFETHRFWEELKLREDPNLWVRMLADFPPTKVDAPLAVKFNRPNSITADQELMLSSKLKSTQMLADRYPELSPYVTHRNRKAKFSYIGGLLDSGKNAKARKFIRDTNLEKSVTFIAILFLLTYLPKGSRLAFWSVVILSEEGIVELSTRVRSYSSDMVPSLPNT